MTQRLFSKARPFARNTALSLVSVRQFIEPDDPEEAEVPTRRGLTRSVAPFDLSRPHDSWSSRPRSGPLDDLPSYSRSKSNQTVGRLPQRLFSPAEDFFLLGEQHDLVLDAEFVEQVEHSDGSIRI